MHANQKKLEVCARELSTLQIAKANTVRDYLPLCPTYMLANVNYLQVQPTIAQTHFNSLHPSSQVFPLENPLTIHPPDLHLSIISSWHNKRHCGMEGSPVHPTIVALQGEKKTVTRSRLLTECNEQRKNEVTRLQTGLPRCSSRYFLYAMLLIPNA